MKLFITGLVCGMFFVGIAWAAQGLVLVNGSSVEIGTTANPLYVEGV